MSAAHIRGIGEPLPAGERVRWEGSPDWRLLARRVFHVRGVAIYFALLLAWRTWDAARQPDPLGYWAAGAGPLLAGASLSLGLLFLLAWLSARTTVYAITDRRVVMRTGIVLSGVVNVPFAHVAGADCRKERDGRGDLALSLASPWPVSYLHLWPHARPWRLGRPEPALRAVPDVERVGEILRGAFDDAERTARPVEAGAS